MSSLFGKRIGRIYLNTAIVTPDLTRQFIGENEARDSYQIIYINENLISIQKEKGRIYYIPLSMVNCFEFLPDPVDPPKTKAPVPTTEKLLKKEEPTRARPKTDRKLNKPDLKAA